VESESKPKPAANAALPSGVMAKGDHVALAYRTAGELLQALASRRVSSRELVDGAISRIEALDQKINAVVVRDSDRAPPVCAPRRWTYLCRACRSAAGPTGQSADLRMIWRRAPKLFLIAIFWRCKTQAVFVA